MRKKQTLFWPTLSITSRGVNDLGGILKIFKYL